MNNAVEIATESRQFEKVYATNATDASFASRIPTTTAPTGAGVIDMRVEGVRTYNTVLVALFGAGADNDTYSHRLIGWQNVGTLWIPVPLVEIAATLGTAVGIAAAEAVATDRFADTLTLTKGPSTCEVYSPADNRIGWYTCDVYGFAKLQFDFDMVLATNGNALMKRL